MPAENAPQLTFASDAEWEAWLEEHHADPDGVWVKIAKKGSGIASVAYPEVLDTAICFGWIDGRRNALDDGTSCSASRRAARAAAGRRSTATRPRR